MRAFRALVLAVVASATTALAQPQPQGLEKATFAGGCFWCMEPPFDKLQGVVSTTSGYTGEIGRASCRERV